MRIDRRTRIGRKHLAIAFAVTGVVTMSTAFGDAVRDGSLGSGARQFSGANFEITPKHGRRSGDNLFHSFQRFDVQRGQTATFTGPHGVKNVIARVTGGRSSSIDGTLRSSIPRANLYLINPAGVVFGPSARLDVSGAFVVTTADRLHLRDGGIFPASTTEAAVLTSAPPTAFGFLSSNPQGVSVRGALLQVPPAKTLSIVSGAISLAPVDNPPSGQTSRIRPRLSAESGRINLLSVGSPGTVEFDFAPDPALADASNIDSVVRVGSFARMGDVDLRGGRQHRAMVETDGNAGGSVVVRAENLRLLGKASIRSASTGAKDGRNIDLLLTRSFKIDGKAEVSTETSGSGAGGDIVLRAPQVAVRIPNTLPLENFGIDSSTFGIIDGGATPSGPAGDIDIRCDDLSLINGGKIASDSFGENGAGGDIRIRANNRILIDNQESRFLTGMSVRVTPTPFEPNGPADLLDANGNQVLDATGQPRPSRRALVLQNPGRGGSIALTARQIDVRNGGRILAEAGEPGRNGRGGAGVGGRIDIQADRLTLDGPGPVGVDISSSIRARALRRTVGNAGDISLTVGTLALRNGAAILVDTLGEGAGGIISINARHVQIDGAYTASSGVPVPSQISAITSSGSNRAGRGGSIFIDTSGLRMFDDGAITTGSGPSARGPAGRIEIKADRIDLESRALVAAGTGTASTGNGGDIRLGSPARPVNMLALDNAAIRAATAGTGAGGNILISANDEFLRNGAVIEAISFPGSGPAGSVVRRSGPAGNIAMSISGNLRLSGGSAVRTDSGESGGGRIDLLLLPGARTFHMDRSSVTTSAAALDQRGGDITIVSPRNIILLRSELVSSSGGTGGNILIDPPFVALVDSSVRANAVVEDGGNIRIEAGTYFRSPLSLVEATSQRSQPGEVFIGAAEADVIAGLISLPITLDDERSRLLERCAPDDWREWMSSFVIIGRGGIPPRPGDPLPTPQIAPGR